MINEDMEELNNLLKSSLPSESADIVFWSILERFSGTQIYFPKEPIEDLRRKAIFELYQEGISVSKIARKYNLSEQGVYKMIKKMKLA